MSLQSEARELLAVFQRVIQALDRFRHPSGYSYAADVAVRLRPLVAQFEQAILAHSRRTAEAVLDDIKPLMHDITGASSKGDLAIFSDDTLDRYNDLATMFQESRHAGQSL